jgi:hypothetical protein
MYVYTVIYTNRVRARMSIKFTYIVTVSQRMLEILYLSIYKTYLNDSSPKSSISHMSLFLLRSLREPSSRNSSSIARHTCTTACSGTNMSSGIDCAARCCGDHHQKNASMHV